MPRSHHRATLSGSEPISPLSLGIDDGSVYHMFAYKQDSKTNQVRVIVLTTPRGSEPRKYWLPGSLFTSSSGIRRASEDWARDPALIALKEHYHGLEGTMLEYEPRALRRALLAI